MGVVLVSVLRNICKPVTTATDDNSNAAMATILIYVSSNQARAITPLYAAVGDAMIVRYAKMNNEEISESRVQRKERD